MNKTDQEGGSFTMKSISPKGPTMSEDTFIISENASAASNFTPWSTGGSEPLPEPLEQAGITGFAAHGRFRRVTRPRDLPDYAKAQLGPDAVPGIEFFHRAYGGHEVSQYRPDTPGQGPRFAQPKDSGSLQNYLPGTGNGQRTVIVEGTRTALSFRSWCPDDWNVVGIGGCHQWSYESLTFLEGKDVVVFFDADIASNYRVWEAAKHLQECMTFIKPASFKFGFLPGKSKESAEDILPRLEEDQREQLLATAFDTAKGLPKQPAKKQDAPYFDGGKLLTVDLVEDILSERPAMVSPEGEIAIYNHGVFRVDGTQFRMEVQKKLGNNYTPERRHQATEVAVNLLTERGEVVPDKPETANLVCGNSTMNPAQGRVNANSPNWRALVKSPVDYEFDAECPTYEKWITELFPDEHDLEDLERTIGTMLDPSLTPPKALFLFGPSRSGKSTLLRLMRAVMGPENTSAVTLQTLSDDPFAAADLYGKSLNVAADLSASHVKDLSTFKMLTGEDVIQGNRKYGQRFTFTNWALFAFSANEIPSVSESSSAYRERIKPFEFPKSFAGSEDQSIEAAMMNELPGILNRWSRAYRRWVEEGYLPSKEQVAKKFVTKSDRVAEFLYEHYEMVPTTPDTDTLPEDDVTSVRELTKRFNEWAGSNLMGERKITQRLRGIDGIEVVRSIKYRRRGFNLRERESDTEEPFGD